MKICGIYKITNIINGKVLIGQSTHIRSRWAQHKWMLTNNKHYNPYFQRAWNKYGKINFTFNILIICPIEKLNEEEIRFIEKHKAQNKKRGYNIRDGGSSGKMSEETKKKISNSSKGRLFSEETRLKLSLSKRGENNPFFGKHLSEEHKKHVSEALSGGKSPNFGRKMSEETKKKIISARRKYNGIDNPFYGKKHSQETKAKISKSRKGKGRWSEEAKEKMSLLQKGRKRIKHSEETKQKMKEAWKIRRLKLSMPQPPILPTPSDLGLS